MRCLCLCGPLEETETMKRGSGLSVSADSRALHHRSGRGKGRGSV